MFSLLREKTRWRWMAILLLASGPIEMRAWDYEQHRLINQLAVAALPTNFPAFVRTPAAVERLGFLAGEPDRWRNTPDLPLRNQNHPDHYLDLEDLEPARLKPENLSHFRYEFAAAFAVERAARPQDFPSIDPLRDADRTRAWPGFLPWAITEHYAKVKSQFSYWRVFQSDGWPEEVRNAEENLLYVMGVMGHYVGDAAQPLHTTRHYNGWVGANPKGFTTTNRIHSWIDGGYLRKVGLTMEELRPRLRPATLLWKSEPKVRRDDVFPEVMTFLLAQYQQVEPLYELEKAGGFSGEGEDGLKGKEFLAKQMLMAAQWLGDLWYTAWQQAPPDTFLKARLAERQLSAPAK